ncbi:MAG: heparinase II/III family protein [Deltaproteobacteria bacterium]
MIPCDTMALRAREMSLVLFALQACSGAHPVPADAASDAASDVAADGTASDVAADAAADVAPAVCSTDDGLELTRALRAPRAAGVSAIAAPGLRLDDLRARFDADATAGALLARARVVARGPVVTLAAGDTSGYQSVASRALAASLVAWHDLDAGAAQSAMRHLASAAVAPAWFSGAQEVSIRVGASLVALAAAVDLLSASGLATADLDAAKQSLGLVVAGVEAWLQTYGGLFFMAFHRDNHGVRFASGLAAAAMMAPATAFSDDALAFAVSHLSVSLRDQTGGLAGWAEGSTYFAYAFEVAPTVLAALDRAWTGADTRCMRCPSHGFQVCSRAGFEVLRPSRDTTLRDLLQWAASLETRGGWLAPVDDSRLSGFAAPLLEQFVGARAFSHWSPDGPSGSLGGSVDVGPLVALALASPPPADRLAQTLQWPDAGTARAEATTASGAAMEAFLLAEHGAAGHGGGHERPDVLALTVAVDGTLVLGGSGYGTYDARAPLARADANSEITVEGVLARDLGAGARGPEAALEPRVGSAMTAGFSEGGVTVRRSVSFEAGALVVRDAVEITGTARDVAWHWHLRGTIDGTAAWAWSVGATRCAVTQEGEAVAPVFETAPHNDSYGLTERHPVVRQSSRLEPGTHTLLTRVTCTT